MPIVQPKKSMPSVPMSRRARVLLLLAKSFIIWSCIALFETILGAFRRVILAAYIGVDNAEALGLISASTLVFLVAYVSRDWIGTKSNRERALVGTVWYVCMVSFDVCLGLAIGQSWKDIARQFDPWQGGKLGIAMSVMFFAPFVVEFMTRPKATTAVKRTSKEKM